MSEAIQQVCVFAGSAVGKRDEFAAAARSLGRVMAERKLALVYGGGSVGLMGVLADAVLEGGGHVIGIIPEALAAREVAHKGASELHVVPSMHVRKAQMVEQSDGFLALPGGLGTLEEICEALTWAQLGIHYKPCGLLNAEGYFDPLIEMLDRAVEMGFVRQKNRDMLLVDDDPAGLLDRFDAYEAPPVEKWLTRDQV